MISKSVRLAIVPSVSRLCMSEFSLAGYSWCWNNSKLAQRISLLHFVCQVDACTLKSHEQCLRLRCQLRYQPVVEESLTYRACRLPRALLAAEHTQCDDKIAKIVLLSTATRRGRVFLHLSTSWILETWHAHRVPLCEPCHGRDALAATRVRKLLQPVPEFKCLQSGDRCLRPTQTSEDRLVGHARARSWCTSCQMFWKTGSSTLASRVSGGAWMSFAAT